MAGPFELHWRVSSCYQVLSNTWLGSGNVSALLELQLIYLLTVPLTVHSLWVEWSGHLIFSSSQTEITILIWKGNWEVKCRALLSNLRQKMSELHKTLLVCHLESQYELNLSNYFKQLQNKNLLKLWKSLVIGWNNKTSFPTFYYKAV